MSSANWIASYLGQSWAGSTLEFQRKRRTHTADKRRPWSQQPRVAPTKAIKASEIGKLDRMHEKANAKANSLANLKSSRVPPGVNVERNK